MSEKKFRLLKSICLKSNWYFIEMTCFQNPVVFYLANPRNQLFIFGIQQGFTIYPVKSIRIFKEIGCFARNLRIWLCLRSFCWYQTTLKAMFFENDAALSDIWNACLIRNAWIFKNFIHVLDYWTIQKLDVSYVVIIVLTGKLIFSSLSGGFIIKIVRCV